jgi:hypothetical protein
MLSADGFMVGAQRLDGSGGNSTILPNPDLTP